MTVNGDISYCELQRIVKEYHGQIKERQGADHRRSPKLHSGEANISHIQGQPKHAEPLPETVYRRAA